MRWTGCAARSKAIAKSEEDVLTYAMFPELARTFLQERAAGTSQTGAAAAIGSNLACGPFYSPNEFNVTLHGETYHIHITGSGRPGEEQRPFFVSVDGVQEEVIIEALNEVEVYGGMGGVVSGGSSKSRPREGSLEAGGKRPRPSHQGHVTTAMPGAIVDVLVVPAQRSRLVTRY